MKRTYTFCPTDVMYALLPVGRVEFTPDGMLCDFSAVGCRMNFTGSSIELRFMPFADAQPAYVRVTVDGTEQRYAIADGSERISLALEDGEHTFEFLRLTEGEVGLTLSEIELTAEDHYPDVLDAPEAPEHRIVFLGDSMTCGYGSIGSVETQEFLTSEEDPTEAYPYKVAAAIDFAPELVSISGHGIVHNWSGGTDLLFSEMEKLQSRTLKIRHVFPDPAEIVVINGSTNDINGGTTDEEMYDGAVSLLRQVAGDYPQARIVWFAGLMRKNFCDVIKKAVEDTDDGRMYYFETEPIDPEKGELGANGHPSVAGHDRAAAELTAFMLENL